ncbi:unnamed protein product [Medioppia subpectinata]|uniref:Uncharacterized protein n=1 Tax=Medioppia subpectinata TaxID=1979941 RepID=A0A7R9KIM1_9ACAR|nr:unnamed protein product [Medioppia subpectinata]CAG2104033.1 unnamed protein product [Medioppia subpectinata]
MADTSADAGSNNLQLLRVNHSVKMAEAFESMFLDESLCDISLCCGGHVVKAHRVILAASSSYFKQILSSINGQTQYPIIFVNGIQMPDLSAMLEFMYRGQVTIPHTQLSSLVKSAEILGVSSLCQLDPNAQNLSENNAHQDKSRTSSPTDSTGVATVPARRGRKRKKPLVVPKPENELPVSDSEATPAVKKAEECDESEDLDGSVDAKDKLAKSKLRSWTQQIAIKANHKDADDNSQPQVIEDNERPLNQLIDESNQLETNDNSGGQQMKKHMLKHSRARRVPLKYSEYTLPKGINDTKQTTDKTDTQKANDTDVDIAGDDPMTGSTITLVDNRRAPSPRLTRGRSRVHSVDDPKTVTPSKEESTLEIGVASTSATADGLNSSLLLTPNTRSRKQTFSPTDGNKQSKDKDKDKDKDKEKDKDKDKDKEVTDSSAQPLVAENKVTPIKSEDESSQTSQSSAAAQVRNKTPVKPQISTLPSSSLIKWRPKDPEKTTTKFTAKQRSAATASSSSGAATTSQDSSPQQLNYQYESIEADGPPVYRCSYCLHCFRSKQNIIDHIRSVHIKSSERYVCPLCHKQFKWKTSLNNHLNQMHPLSRPTPLRHFDKTRKSLT